MQLITAEIIKLRAENDGWLLKEKGYLSQIDSLTSARDSAYREAAHWENAAKTGVKIDTNSQAIEKKSDAQFAYLRTDLATTQRKLTETEARLDSCQGSIKYVAAISAIGGGFLGWTLKGKTQQLGFTNPFATPQIAQRPAWTESQRMILKPIGTTYDFTNRMPIVPR
jgi:hypothetical protein